MSRDWRFFCPSGRASDDEMASSVFRRVARAEAAAGTAKAFFGPTIAVITLGIMVPRPGVYAPHRPQ